VLNHPAFGLALSHLFAACLSYADRMNRGRRRAFEVGIYNNGINDYTSDALAALGEIERYDRRGIYLPIADLHWSLYGVPEQPENDKTQERTGSFRGFSCWR
jgi:hypothetical protein